MSGTLDIRGLSAGYGARAVVADLTLAPWRTGHVTSLVGPNGAGKSTLLRAIAGLIPATGSVTFEGVELNGLSAAERARRVAYMPQTLPQDVALTVIETVIAALEASPSAQGPGQAVEAAMAALERVGAAELALKRLDRLSGGQRQIAGLAQAMVRKPRLLLLDEPTSALDLRHQLEVLSLAQAYAREEDAAVVLVLHDLQAAARVSDHMVVLADGALRVEGTPQEALTARTLAEVWQVRARVEVRDTGLQLLVDGVL